MIARIAGRIIRGTRIPLVVCMAMLYMARATMMVVTCLPLPAGFGSHFGRRNVEMAKEDPDRLGQRLQR